MTLINHMHPLHHDARGGVRVTCGGGCGSRVEGGAGHVRRGVLVQGGVASTIHIQGAAGADVNPTIH